MKNEQVEEENGETVVKSKKRKHDKTKDTSEEINKDY